MTRITSAEDLFNFINNMKSEPSKDQLELKEKIKNQRKVYF